MAAPLGGKNGQDSARPLGPRKVYIETSVWGMTLRNQPRALREPTLQFLGLCASGAFRPYISAVVLEEIGRAPRRMAARMRQEIDKLAPLTLQISDRSEGLAAAYLRAGVVPAKKPDDARHVAVATVAGLELVVSWNHRHLANERKWTLFGAVNRLAGYDQPLMILTPFEATR